MEDNDTKMPLLIAKQKDARFMKDDYKLGWLMQGTEEEGWYWIVWGSTSKYDNVIKIANQVLTEKGDRAVYLSEQPLLKGVICKDKLDLQNITEQCR